MKLNKSIQISEGQVNSFPFVYLNYLYSRSRVARLVIGWNASLDFSPHDTRIKSRVFLFKVYQKELGFLGLR